MWCSWLRHFLKGRRSWVLFPMGSWDFSLTQSFQPHYGPGVDSASKSLSNYYQKYFLGKGGRCLALTTLPPSCKDFLECLGIQPHAALEICLEVYRDCFITKQRLRHNKNWSYFELLLKEIPTNVSHRRLIRPPISEGMFLFVFVCARVVCACVP